MQHDEFQYEIAVVGGGPAGLSAALAAARRGRKVVLLEKNGYLGGNATLGLPLLGFLDLDGRRVTGGLAQEYVRRLTARGQCFGHRTCPKHNSGTNIDPEGFKILAVEMCREAGIDVLLHLEACRVEVEQGEICRRRSQNAGSKREDLGHSNSNRGRGGGSLLPRPPACQKVYLDKLRRNSPDRSFGKGNEVVVGAKI